jgi:hypothetical protein
LHNFLGSSSKRTFNENTFVGRQVVLFVNNNRRTDRETYIVVNHIFFSLFVDVIGTNFPGKFSKYSQTFPDKLFIAEGKSDRGTDINIEQSNFAILVLCYKCFSNLQNIF